jgi:hypothetical protein
VQGKLVAKLAGRLQHAVLIEKSRNLCVIGEFETGSEISSFEIWPQDVIPQHLLV